MIESSEHKRPERPLVFVHVGDLHLTELAPSAARALHEREHKLRDDLRAIIADITSIAGNGAVDFVYLPGDLAENAGRAEYAALADVLQHLECASLCLIPGDHDRARGNMDEFARFRRGLRGAHKQPEPVRAHVEVPLDGKGPPPDCLAYCECKQHYYCREYNGVLCLFLDLVSAGYGQKGIGLDFRLGAQQADWVKTEIGRAKKVGQPCAVFMHCYPADMHEPDQAADLYGLFWDGGVRLVEMGHTHYNDLAHDGRTQYAAARSVGQNEDGPVGYAVVALDGDVTSWRFKQLQQTWPFVLITSPADRRLATGPLKVGHDDRICVRALILTDEPPQWAAPDPCPPDPWKDATDDALHATTLQYCAWCSVDGGEWVRMDYKGDCMFELWVDWRLGSKKVSVNVTDGRWMSRMKDFIDLDSIEPAARGDAFTYRVKSDKPASGALQVGAWPVKGIRGDQLGPNNGGRKW